MSVAKGAGLLSVCLFFFIIFVLAAKVSFGTKLQRCGSLRSSVLPGVGGAAAWRGLVRQS